MTEAAKEEILPNEIVPKETTQEDIDRAKTYGWHDPEAEDFRGDPETALGPKEFLEKMEAHPSMKRENFTKLEHKLMKLESTLEQTRTDQEKFIEMSKNAAINEYKDKQRQAVEDGDTEAYDKAQKGIEETEKQTETKSVVPELEAFKQRNNWYGIDIDKTIYANQVDNILSQRQLSPTEHFKELENAISEKFPTRQAANVQKNGRLKAPSKSKTFDAMPEDNKAHCMRMMRGAKNPEQFKKTYTETHWSNQDES
jgi:hypothetical protein